MKKNYALLNVNEGADLSEIKKAYRRSVHLYHPDANGGIGDPEKFKEVVKAYNHILKHYKSLGIKPVPQKKKASALIYEKLGSIFGNSRKEAAGYARNTDRKQRRTMRKDEFATLDPLLLKLSFDELKLRFEESQNEFVVREAARALTHCFGAGAFPLLRGHLPCAAVAVAEEILYCLGLIGDQESILILEKYVRHGEVKIACAAVRSLRNINQGLARTLLDKMAREGRSMKLSMRHFFNFFDGSRIRKLLRSGAINRFEMDIARFLQIHTRQPMPVILRELGFVIAE
ncbi:MAG: DnaJ domain-containing protein [Nitrospinae bacterium]|nr:DnaJ domain-containing protein [Nitrospinota bacterium]